MLLDILKPIRVGTPAVNLKYEYFQRIAIGLKFILPFVHRELFVLWRAIERSLSVVQYILIYQHA